MLGRSWRPALLVAVALVTGFGLASQAQAPEDAEPTARASSDDPAVRELLDELERRHRELDVRERSLDDREAQLGALESQIETRLAELETLGETVARRIQEFEDGQGDKVRRLAKIYGAMPAGQAASLIEAMDVALATQIVARMKEKQSAAVLAQVSEERALAMSRRVARPLSAGARTGDGR